MPSPLLYAGALSLLMRHHLRGCAQSANQVADVLERLAEIPEIDSETRLLCEQLSRRLNDEAHFRNICSVR